MAVIVRGFVDDDELALSIAVRWRW